MNNNSASKNVELNTSVQSTVSNSDNICHGFVENQYNGVQASLHTAARLIDIFSLLSDLLEL